MDKRLKPLPVEEAVRLQEAFFQGIATHGWDVAAAVREMRRLSRLTQPEFARHRGISVQALRQIETGCGNPTLQTLDKIAKVFGLRVGFVPMRPEAKDTGGQRLS